MRPSRRDSFALTTALLLGSSALLQLDALSAPPLLGDVAQRVYVKPIPLGGDTLLFGVQLAADGDTLVVGAPAEDSGGLPSAGAAYVFVRDGLGWTQQARLTPLVADTQDFFGSVVDISGDTIVVGAWGEDGRADGVNGLATDNGALNSGAAYVFVRNGTTWNQQAYLKASRSQPVDVFGDAVAISGNTIVVGARGEDSAAVGVNGDDANDDSSSAGAAYVFIRNGHLWSQQAYLKASNTEPTGAIPGLPDSFGGSVDIDGDTIAVGAWWEASDATGIDGDQANNNALNAGAVYVFERVAGVWSQQAYIKASNTDPGDAFSDELVLDGDTLLVNGVAENGGAAGINGDDSDDSVFDAGAVYVFVRQAGAWSQQAYIKAPVIDVEDFFGGSLALSGDVAVVGMGAEDSADVGVGGDLLDNDLPNSGAAYIYRRVGTTWTLAETLKASSPDAGDAFGVAVAVGPGELFVGASREASASATDQDDDSLADAGAAYVFDLDFQVWSDHGCALAGAAGAPALSGSGELLVGGGANSVDLVNAAPNAFMGLFLALSDTPTFFKGGTLKPVPVIQLIFANTSGAGELHLPFALPPGFPTNIEIWIQAAITDAGAPVGVALSNALLGVTS